jgi:hypothetical protein
MAITVGTLEPTSFHIGDSVSWTRHEADYLPPTWNLVYGFYGPTRFTVTSTDSGTDHLAALPLNTGSVTTIKPGKYSWIVKATDGTSIITLQSGEMVALPDLTVADSELDAAEAQLALVESAYNSLVTGIYSEISIDGVQYTLRSNIADLKSAREAARREVERIKAARRVLFRQGNGSLFVTRFCQ